MACIVILIWMYNCTYLYLQQHDYVPSSNSLPLWNGIWCEFQLKPSYLFSLRGTNQTSKYLHYTAYFQREEWTQVTDGEEQCSSFLWEKRTFWLMLDSPQASTCSQICFWHESKCCKKKLLPYERCWECTKNCRILVVV